MASTRIFSTAFSLTLLIMTANLANAVPALADGGQGGLGCTECHGMPPLDEAYRDFVTGGFRGNHSTHNPPATAPQTACEKCHPGSSRYVSDHRNGFIDMTSNINDSPDPAGAVYNKPRLFTQTSNPVLTTCSNVNCHFENVTPTWGSDPASTSCSTCHGAPPADGSHPAHVSFTCSKCHPDHTTEPRPFSHATSVGRRPLIVGFVTAPNSGGSYSGDLAYPDYLPSQGPARSGSCQNIYCHSDGKGGAPNVAPVWSGSLPGDCSGCHGTGSSFGAPAYANAGAGQPRANSHGKHVHTPADCGKCHAGTTVDGTSIKPGSLLHANGAIDVTFDAGIAGPNATWSAATETCSAVYCHSDGTSVATGQPAGGTMVWGAAIPACSACHGYPPSYDSGTPKANSHTHHNFSCNTCHAGTTADGTTISNASLHGNHAYDVIPGAGVSFTYVYAATGGTCSNISCHNNGTAVWGSTLTCGSCHTESPGGD